ncbi:MAG TPA: YCF48-related protein, partial [Candidatus Syntrophosphaera thermopropionivorans]|nr:YCF48-related protein [Candidatus Syntrophosphaera thermopropionivorans]
KAFYEIFFVNDQVGYIVGLGGKVTKTTDGGETWFTVGDNISTSANLYCTYWKNELNGYAGSGGGVLYITNDGGVTWSSITVGANANIRDIYFRDANNGVLVKDGGEIYYTTTGGNTADSWLAATEQAIGHMMSVTCDHNGVFWAAGYSSNPSQQGNSWALLKSFDNGATWQEEGFPPLTFNPTQLTNISTGGGKLVVVGKNNVILAQLEVPEHVTLISPPDNSVGLDPNNVILTWAPSPYGSVAAYYGVYVAPDPETLFDYYYFETTETSFNLSAAPGVNLGYGNTWYWAVLPVNEIMDTPDPNSDNFMIWRFTTQAQEALEPPSLRIEKVNNQIKLSWDAVQGATSYKIYGASDPYGNYTLITSTTSLNYIITNPGNMQFFKVIATNE